MCVSLARYWIWHEAERGLTETTTSTSSCEWRLEGVYNLRVYRVPGMVLYLRLGCRYTIARYRLQYTVRVYAVRSTRTTALQIQ